MTVRALALRGAGGGLPSRPGAGRGGGLRPRAGRRGANARRGTARGAPLRRARADPAKPHLPVRIVLVPTVVDSRPTSGRPSAAAVRFVRRRRPQYRRARVGRGGRPSSRRRPRVRAPGRSALRGPRLVPEGFAEYLSYLEPGASGRLSPPAPARHMVRLRGSPWLPLEELRNATRSSAAFAGPTFYAQSWLAVHWLAERGASPRDLRPRDLDRAVERLGVAGVEAALRGHFETLGADFEETFEAVAPLQPDPTQAWEVELALAEADRELGRLELAEASLYRLRTARPGEPAVAAALGALAMDRGQYPKAESLLAEAANDAAASARACYRLALMLLRSDGEQTRERARRAAEQARRALARVPEARDYRLALAQALMVDEQWDAAARELNALARGCRLARTRRRGDARANAAANRRSPGCPSQASRPRPRLPPRLPNRSSSPPSRLLQSRRLRRPCVGPLPERPSSPAASTTSTASGPDKVIVMRHPLLTLRIRERKGRPAKLFHPPEKGWTAIPCGAKGWTVNIAYYPYRNASDLLGDAAAILF